MKKKITFPDWTRMARQLITRNKENDPRPIWREYDQDQAGDSLSLRVTLEIAGGSTLFETFDSEEARAAAYLERSRRVTYANVLGFAEQLWRAAPHREYVVLFRPENQNVGREAVCIYRRLYTPTAEDKVVTGWKQF